MTTTIWRMDNGFLAVRDSAYDTQPDTATWTPLAQYDEILHPVIHKKLSDNVKNATWDAQAQTLTINGAIEIDGVWIQARLAELNTASANKETDSSERAALLQIADNALLQIASDLTAIENGKTAAQTATTLAQMRTIILGMLDVQAHTVNRQDREIRVLRALVRSG